MESSANKSGYRSLIRAPGIPFLLVGSTIGRISGGMVPIGVVLLLQRATQSFATAGTIMGLYALAMVLAGPARSALAVRVGHKIALVALAVFSGTGLILVVAMALALAPTYLLASGMALSGACIPPFGALMRASWSSRLNDIDVPRAFGLDSAIEESSFVVGPLLASGILAVAGPHITVVVTAVSCVVGGLIMAWSAGGRRASGAPALRRAEGVLGVAGRLSGLLFMFVGIGLAIGALEVGVPAFAVEKGAPALSGVLYAVAAIASAGAAVAWSRWSRSHRARTDTAWLGLAFGVGVAVLAIPSSVAAAIPALLIAGCTMGPAVMSAYLAADTSVATAESKTHASVLASVACNAGAAGGASIAGIATDSGGAAMGFLSLGLMSAVVVVGGALVSGLRRPIQ
jgi:MFS transporter